MEQNVFKKSSQYEIYVGIKDKDSYEEILTTDDFRQILIEICNKKNIAFSLITQHGGYAHNKGYTTETSLRIVLINADYEEVKKLGEAVKNKVNTDTILISKTDIEFAYV